MMNFEDFENQRISAENIYISFKFRDSADEPAVEVQTGRRSQGWLDLDGTNEVLNEGCLYGVSEG